jgi:hypothetical protein
MLIYLFILGQDLLNWPILQFARVVSPIKYRDTYWVLADADCFKEIGSRIYGLESETGCPGYIYGQPLLKVLNILEIQARDTEMFAHALQALFSVALSFVIIKLAKKIMAVFLLALLVMLSPGTQLMLYNGNFDLLIFVLVVFGYFLIKKNFIIAGLFLLFLSGVFKFYTIPLLLLMALFLPKIRHKVVALTLLIVSCASAVYDLYLMQEPIPSSGYAQFGFSIYTNYLEQMEFSNSPVFGFVLSLTLFSFSILVVSILGKSKNQLKGESKPSNHLLFLVFAIVFLACYFAGLSYDPRLLYLTLAGFYLATSVTVGHYRLFIYMILVWSSWMSTGIELGFIAKGHTGFHPLRFLQVSNDLSIGLLTAALCLQILKTLPLSWHNFLFSRINVLQARNH